MAGGYIPTRLGQFRVKSYSQIPHKQFYKQKNSEPGQGKSFSPRWCVRLMSRTFKFFSKRWLIPLQAELCTKPHNWHVAYTRPSQTRSQHCGIVAILAVIPKTGASVRIVNSQYVKSKMKVNWVSSNFVGWVHSTWWVYCTKFGIISQLNSNTLTTTWLSV